MWCYMRNELDTTKRLQSDLSRSEGTNLWSSNYKSLWSHTSFKSLWRRTYKWLQSDLCSLMHCQSDQLIKAINTITHSYMHGNERCVHVVLWSYLTTMWNSLHQLDYEKKGLAFDIDSTCDIKNFQCDLRERKFHTVWWTGWMKFMKKSWPGGTSFQVSFTASLFRYYLW